MSRRPTQEALPFVPGSLVNGQEVPDPRPIAVPLGFGAPESLPDMVKRLTSAALASQGLNDVDSFEEADDFDLDEDDGFDHSSPYEENFDPSYTGLKAVEQRFGVRGPSPKKAPPIDPKAAEKAAREARVEEMAEAYRRAFPGPGGAPGAAPGTRP